MIWPRVQPARCTVACPRLRKPCLFADQAELLACLALDWLSTQILNRWWWRHLLRNADVRQAVTRAWIDVPEYVPAALAHVDAAGDVVAFLQALSDAEVDQIIKAVVERYGLHALRNATSPEMEPRSLDRTLDVGPLPSPTPDGEPSLSREPGAAPSRSREADTGAAAHKPHHPGLREPPWQALVPARAAAMSVRRQLLLGVGLSLVRLPAPVRTTDFADRVRRWYHGPAAEAAWPRSPASIARPGPPTEEQAPASIAPSRPPTEEQSAGEAALPADSAPVQAPELEAPAVEGTAGPAATEPDMPATPASLAEAASAESAWLDLVTPQPPEAVPAASEVRTRFGGLFYLVNAAQALGLYGDFTTPDAPGIDLPIWDFLALLGEAFLGQALREDPVWALLAQLTGRGDEAPGLHFQAPDAWRAPDEWQRVFEPAGCRWTVERARLRAWHPAGFWLLDVPAGPDPAGQVAAELAGLALQPALPGSLPHPQASHTDALARWVGWWTAYLRARLLAALGLQEPDELPATLFHYRARVLVTAARLDVMLRLDDLALAVRLAGLDRNPGWVPAAGRTIVFHFE